ncbi:hypothetical protein BBJ28_00021303 [Nothophytophthora sp. Chile5]|nr:hypothetical protein BBJ28_00021303 [Nothophytophthora sp. Chile5]
MVGPTGYVFTTGGIGPTHDDITYESVAKAFGRGVELHEPTLVAMEKNLKENYPHLVMNEGLKRMAVLPVDCKLLHASGWTPIAVVENVYILPGIPSMVTDMLTCNEEHFVGVPIHRVIKEHPNVVLGSYVNLSEDKTGVRDLSFNTRLTVEGRDETEVKQVGDKLIELFGGSLANPSSAV